MASPAPIPPCHFFPPTIAGRSVDGAKVLMVARCLIRGCILNLSIQKHAKEQKEAAKDQKEAKRYEAKARMLETYNRLLSQDLGLMSEEEKADHATTMRSLKNKLFTEFN